MSDSQFPKMPMLTVIAGDELVSAINEHGCGVRPGKMKQTRSFI